MCILSFFGADNADNTDNYNSNVSQLEYEANEMRLNIWNRLEQLQEPKDCDYNTIEYLTCRLHSQCGYGCYINSVLQCLAHSHRESKTMVFTHEHTALGGTAWSTWMLPVSSCQNYYNEHKQLINTLATTTNLIVHNDEWSEHREWVPEYTKVFLNRNNMRYPTAWFLGVVNGYLFRGFQPNVERYIATRINETFGNEDNIDLDISCHIRWTDKVAGSSAEALKFNVREYINEMDHFIIMKQNGGRHYHGSYDQKYDITAYVATDEPNVIREINTKFKQYTWYYNNVGAQTSNKRIGNNRLSDDDGIINVIYDLIMMSKAKYFVGTMSSNMGRIVFQLFANQYVDPNKYVYSLDEEYYGIV